MTAHVGLLALDVDGTLLTPEHEVTEGVRQAVRLARAAGVEVVVCSSRGPSGLAPVQHELDLTDAWFVAFQGALVGRRSPDGDGWELLGEHRISPDVAEEVVDLALAAGLCPSWYAGSGWYAPTLDEVIERAGRITGEVAVASDVRTTVAAVGPPHKVLVIAGDPASQPALDRLRGRLPDGVVGVHSHADYLEVTAAGVDKGRGLRLVADALGVPLSACAAVGDGANDLPMLAVAGVPVAMGQAPECVKAAAAWTTEDNTHDGAARAIEALVRGMEETS